MGRCSPPIGHKLTVLSLTKFGDRKNLRVIFFFRYFSQKNDSEQNFVRHFLCKYRKNSGNNKSNKIIDSEREKANKGLKKSANFLPKNAKLTRSVLV